jgi:hypothetical protein
MHKVSLSEGHCLLDLVSLSSRHLFMTNFVSLLGLENTSRNRQGGREREGTCL